MLSHQTGRRKGNSESDSGSSEGGPAAWVRLASPPGWLDLRGRVSAWSRPSVRPSRKTVQEAPTSWATAPSFAGKWASVRTGQPPPGASIPGAGAQADTETQLLSKRTSQTMAVDSPESAMQTPRPARPQTSRRASESPWRRARGWAGSHACSRAQGASLVGSDAEQLSGARLLHRCCGGWWASRGLRWFGPPRSSTRSRARRAGRIQRTFADGVSESLGTRRIYTFHFGRRVDSALKSLADKPLAA